MTDGAVNISCNDFSRFDWGFMIAIPSSPSPSLDGVTGYLVLSSNNARSDKRFAQQLHSVRFRLFDSGRLGIRSLYSRAAFAGCGGWRG